MRLCGTVGVLIAAGLAYGQNAAKLEFDAASLKPSGARSIRMENDDPIMYSFSRATLWDLLFNAWRLADYDKQISGPAWLREDSFDLIAHFPQGTTKQDFRTMLQNLLIERFRLVAHTEIHDLPVYALVVGKNGPKLGGKGTALASSRLKDDDCFPTLRPGRPDIAVRYAEDGRRCLAAQQEPIATLVHMLRREVDRPLIDRTGLTGRYDVALEFGQQLSDQSSTPELPDIFTAIQQLGLRLESLKAPFEILVVDHAERVPLAN
jgi:uncharacterized protein (TIGR03435 family)